MLHESQEDYLEAILMIRRGRGFCRNVDIAERLGRSKPSVTKALGNLAHRGLAEVVDRDVAFAGGVIAPGVETSASALFSHANRLSAIELEDPHTAIGGNTAQAIQAGIVYGEADRVDGLVRRIFEQLGYEAPVVATGGLASRVAPLSRTITHVNKELTLEGLRRIYEARG